MSMKYLGDTLDIHGGGQDLVFPHHENEIAQSESFTGKPFVKYWLHNGLVQLGEDKMSKSLGNLITIKEALERYSADAIRIFVLGSHYRSPLTYSEVALEAADKGAWRLWGIAHIQGRVEKAGEKIDIEPYRQRFIEAMDDDFNTAQAIATVFDLAREINRGDESGLEVGEACEMLKELAGVLGLTLKALEKPPLDIELLQQLLISINKWRREADLKEIPIDEFVSEVAKITDEELEAKKVEINADKSKNTLKRAIVRVHYVTVDYERKRRYFLAHPIKEDR